jgi:hypothetical protein
LLPGLRSKGFVSRAGEYCFMMPDEPLAHVTGTFIRIGDRIS